MKGAGWARGRGGGAAKREHIGQKRASKKDR